MSVRKSLEKHHVERLIEDHANAKALAEGLAGIKHIKIDTAAVQTNMLFLQVTAEHARPLAEHLKQVGILILPGANLRLVTHLDVSAADVGRVITAFQGYFAGR